MAPKIAYLGLGNMGQVLLIGCPHFQILVVAKSCVLGHV